LPGVNVKPDLRRYYPDTTLAHVVGYLGEVRDADLVDAPQLLQLGDLVGRKGLERFYDRQLRGVPGRSFVQVDAIGRELGPARDFPTRPALRGLDLVVGIDLRLQHQAHKSLDGHPGALLLMDVRTGELLTALSMPDFNPNVFSHRLSQETWDRLNDARRKPLFSRLHQAQHPPGSTFKMVTLSAAMEAGVSPYYRVNCNGSLTLGNRVAHCWLETGHGSLDMRQPLAQSCDVYYYVLGLMLGLEPISRWARAFHLGERTGIDLPGERPGLIPDSAWYNEHYGRRGWTRGVLLNVAIGQGEVLVTPLQILQYAALLANGGWTVTPHVGVSLLDQDRHLSHVLEYGRRETPLDEKTLKVIRGGLEDAVAHEHGTAHWLQRSRYSVAGKTGTAENPHGEPHSWFMGYAPADEPRVAVVALVENGGHGSEAAAPLAFQLLDEYFRLQEEGLW